MPTRVALVVAVSGDLAGGTELVMMKIFGRKPKRPTSASDKELTVEDLVTLERYEEAREMLKKRLKLYPKDLHAHLKLAEVYLALEDMPKALDEYQFVADSQADDGFFDKAVAILGKAARLAPGDDMLPRRIEHYRRLKRLETRRKLAIEGLLANTTTGRDTAAGNRALEVELLWNKIAKCHLVDDLGAEELKKLFSAMEMRHAKSGTLMADEGDSKQAMYLVVDGIVEARAQINGRMMNVRSFSTGDIIGDSALLERKVWPARYEVVEPATVFKLDRAGMERAMKGNDDPLAFISSLRKQNNDRDVAISIQKLRK